MMCPDVSHDLRVNWGIFGGCALVCALLLTWLSGDARIESKLAREQRAYQQREGDSDVSIRSQVLLQQKANEQLADTIEGLKRRVGITPLPAFTVQKEDADDRGFYFSKLFQATKRQLYDRAVKRRVTQFEPDLGYRGKLERVLPEDEVRNELIRLQLIAKAVLLALSTENPLVLIEVAHGDIVSTGPEGRPVLLNEYAFMLRVRGSLKDILWLLHQLGEEHPGEDVKRAIDALHHAIQREARVQVRDLTQDDLFPLIVRGLRITSENREERDSINLLDAEIDIAGMEFLNEQQRRSAGIVTKETRARAGNISGSRSSSSSAGERSSRRRRR